MSKTHDILNECLERLRQGELLEECLLDYPEQAGELRQLIQAALEVERFSGTVKPRASYLQRSQAALEMAYQQEFSSPATRSAGVRRTAYRVALGTIMAVVALAIVFTGGLALSVRASEQAMPGETLYPVKLATERIRLALAVSDEQKVSYLVQFAEARVEEMTYAAAKGDAEKADSAIDLLEHHLAGVSSVVVQKETSGAIAGSSQASGLEKIENIVQTSYTRVMTQLEYLETPGPAENPAELPPASSPETPVASEDPPVQEPESTTGAVVPEKTQETEPGTEPGAPGQPNNTETPASENKAEAPGQANKPETPGSDNKSEAPGQTNKPDTGSSGNADRVDDAYSQVIDTIDSAKGKKPDKPGK